ncbi:MAG: DUF1489 domain-containing protein [Rhodospirillaceae bacterium]|nr:DUF1489 domain-containing protein [Rhodospirillaceae bacterium]
MTLNLIKLSVGTENIADLAMWQKERVKHNKSIKRWKTHQSSPRHITRQWPKRRDELLDGGSIYWVIKGAIRARQRIIALEEVPVEADDARDGKMPKPKCALVLDRELIPTQAQPHRAFQGWRYLDGAKAPKDSAKGSAEIPEELAAQLSDLGLL